ncbi:polygalacturonase [Tripterygium wilfordii]|uniref:Polygalacturonase n=1 Tax=Tripterygium wilfordii TaxID=458696 RepID=A0A7J7DCP4_TRIWF|nr:polygalacturonase [Tripterygium wilfordii]
MRHPNLLAPVGLFQRVRLQSSSGSGVALGSEMSGGISHILVENLHLYKSLNGIELKTSRGRGGYIKDILISDVEMDNIELAIQVTGHCDSHPDNEFDPNAVAVVNDITFENMVGSNISFAGNFIGLYESPFTSICLSNITLSITGEFSASWFCSKVAGFSQNVSPEPCPNLQGSIINSSFSLTDQNSLSESF